MIVYHGLTEIIKIRTFRIRRIYEFWQEILYYNVWKSGEKVR